MTKNGPVTGAEIGIRMILLEDGLNRAPQLVKERQISKHENWRSLTS